VSTLSDHWVVALPDDTCFWTAATIASAIYMYDDYTTNVVRDANMGQAFGWAIWGLTVGMNLWATSLMFIRAWYVAFDPIVT
jgi:hypothetical protein